MTYKPVVGSAEMNHTSTDFIADYECKAIPPSEIRTAIEGMRYGSPERVMFRMLAITGCRIACLDKMTMQHLSGRFIYWETSKVGGKWRKEHLPDDYLEELAAYRTEYRANGKRLFGISGESFVRYFNRDIRPHLGGLWNVKTNQPTTDGFGQQYLLKIKGLRKSFSTYDFARNYAKWKDADVALEMTSKRMKHSTAHITAHHYIENFDALGIKKVTTDLDPLKNLSNQMRILDFL